MLLIVNFRGSVVNCFGPVNYCISYSLTTSVLFMASE